MRAHLRGFTLVELLISIALGATILLATTQLFVEGRDSFQYQSQWRELHERGRHLMQFFTAELRKAGYPKSTFSGTPLTATNNDGDSQSDTLTISYDNAADCAGSSSTTITYLLDGDDLRCNGNGDASPTPQTLTSYIEGLQFRYGVDTDTDGSIDRYLTADAVSDWEQVHTITIAVLLRSERAVRQEIDNATHTLLETDHGPFNDYYLRKSYQTTVQLRNH